MKKNSVWQLPVPSTALLGAGPVLEDRPGREVAIQFEYEAEHDDENRSVALVFEGVESFRFTFMTACHDSMLDAYDELVDCGRTAWLEAVRVEVARRTGTADGIKHLMIFFDDGPCYEAICRSFRVDESSTSR